MQYFQNATRGSALLTQPPPAPALFGRSDAATAEPIIGLPDNAYARFEVMPLKDDVEAGMDVSYYGPLRFGTPPQELTVSVDTGSADLWMPVRCPSCSGEQFDAASSSTYVDTRKRVSVSYVRSVPLLSFVAARDETEGLGCV